VPADRITLIYVKSGTIAGSSCLEGVAQPLKMAIARARLRFSPRRKA
jgi:hypothetical protein